MSEWTTDTLKEHHDALMDRDRETVRLLREADLRAVALAREGDRERVQLALANIERQRAEDRAEDLAWRANQNEWRGESRDRQEMYATRDSVEQLRISIDQRFEQLQRTQEQSRIAVGNSLRGTIGLGLTALGVVISIVVVVANTLL